MPVKQFIITGTERVGSSTFANSLSYHSKIACGWEWSLRVPWWRRVKACRSAMHGDFRLLSKRHQDHMASEFSEESTCLGYRNLFRANDKWLKEPSWALSLYLDRFYDMTHWWQSDPAIHVIHIVRTNNLAWLRSKFVARKTSSFGAGNLYPDDLRLHIPVHRALKRVQMKQWLDLAISQISATNAYHVIRYEDMLTDRDSVVSDAQSFLGLEAELMPPAQIPQRQSKGIPIEQHISNYEQLYAALESAELLTAPMPGRTHDNS
ncbi:MAG TPA: sulfotransferase [Woeseiaceae bacterium]|jgi:hypothetical protein|nr:sulfotransferase [Woeseiaceae bacterium]